MKKIILFILIAIIPVSSYSQEVIKFLGIPIDGTKKEMISKLQAKGYEYNADNDILFGEFNGTDVLLSVQTVNNKVWRISILDAKDTDETNIKIRFNKLFEQFSNNSKYNLVGGQKLKDSDNISYEISVHKKRFDAVFAPKDISINGVVWFMIGDEYERYRIVIFYENLNNAANGDDL